jgi:hypothetical protein
MLLVRLFLGLSFVLLRELWRQRDVNNYQKDTRNYCKETYSGKGLLYIMELQKIFLLDDRHYSCHIYCDHSQGALMEKHRDW